MRKIIFIIFFILFSINNVLSASLILSQTQISELDKVYTTNGSYGIDRYSSYPIFSSNDTKNGEMFQFYPEQVANIQSFKIGLIPECNYVGCVNNEQSSFQNSYMNVNIYLSDYSTPTSLHLYQHFNINSFPIITDAYKTFTLTNPIIVNARTFIFIELIPQYNNISQNSWVDYGRFLDRTGYITNPDIAFSEIYEDSGYGYTSQESHLIPEYKKYMQIYFYGNPVFNPPPTPTPGTGEIIGGTPVPPYGIGLPIPAPDTNFTIPIFNPNSTLCNNQSGNLTNNSCIPQQKIKYEIPNSTGLSKTLTNFGYCSTTECTISDIINFAYDVSMSFAILSFFILGYKVYIIYNRK